MEPQTNIILTEEQMQEFLNKWRDSYRFSDSLRTAAGDFTLTLYSEISVESIGFCERITAIIKAKDEILAASPLTIENVKHIMDMRNL